MKLFEYFENIELILNLKQLLNQFNKDILSREECLNEMRVLISNSKLKWILDSLKDIKEPSIYIQTIKELQ